MPGVLFVVCIPTAEYEKCLIHGTSPVVPPSADMISSHGLQKEPAGKITLYNFHEEFPLIYLIFLFYDLCICSVDYSLSLLDLNILFKVQKDSFDENNCLKILL